MQSINQPDFFIVGAPKCGTTALYTYLAGHPDIGMSRHKEPLFFASERGRQRGSVTLAHYLSMFDHATGKSRIGEASTGYLASQRAPREILAFNRNAQIIVMVRNPVDVLHSLHSQRIFGGSEHILDFELAMKTGATRYWKHGPFRREAVLGLDYRETTRFSEHIRRYIKVFGRERVHVIVFDDFARAPGVEYEKVLSFLGLPWDGRHQFGIVNANRRRRSQRGQDVLRQLSEKFRLLRRCFPDSCRRMRAAAERINLVYEPRRPMESGFRRELELEYAPEIRNLESLLDQNLSHWLAPATPVARNAEGLVSELLSDARGRAQELRCHSTR
jgi:Sulfotransferase domain